MEQKKNPQAPAAPSSPSSAHLPVPRAAAHPPGCARPPEAAAPPAFDPVPVRPRHDGWTPARQRAFIEHLAETLSPQAAAARVDMSVQSARELRRRPGAEGFSAAWDAALRRGFRRELPAFLLDKALNGTVKRRYYHGQLVAEEVVHSERLLLALLDKGDKLLDGHTDPASAAIAKDWDGSMERLEAGTLETPAAQGPWRIYKDRYGRLATNYPPPPGMTNCGHGRPGAPDYERELTASEYHAYMVREQRPGGKAVQGHAARDAYFGFKPGRRPNDRISHSKRRG
jgi:hypothetical protein